MRTRRAATSACAAHRRRHRRSDLDDDDDDDGHRHHHHRNNISSSSNNNKDGDARAWSRRCWSLGSGRDAGAPGARRIGRIRPVRQHDRTPVRARHAAERTAAPAGNLRRRR